jgi:single-strand DNA-binding protein
MSNQKIKMGDTTVTGNLAEDPREITTPDGRTFTAIRILENRRSFDREQQQWVDSETVGYDVAIQNDRLRQRALHSLSKGDLITVRGNYEISPYVNKNTGEAGMNHRIGAREVSVSMFDDRFDPTVAVDRDAAVAMDRNVSQERGVEKEWPPGFTAERTPLGESGLPPAPGPPPITPSISEERLQELARRQQMKKEQEGAMYQQQYNTLPSRPGAQGPGF